MRARTVRPRFFLLLSALAILIFAILICSMNARMRRDADRLKQLRQEQQTLVDEIRSLEQQIDYVQSDAYIINAAREQLGYVMPGEIRYMSSGNSSN